MSEIVEAKPTKIVVFDEVASIIAEYKIENENLAFEYASKEGAKAAKSHISNLRKVKTKIGEVHKEAKAEALAFGRRLDAKKNEYNGEVDKMIKFHKDPLDTIEAKLIEESVRRQQELAEAEEKRLLEIDARERAVLMAEEKISREKDEAEEKIRREKAAESERVMKEQREEIALIEAEKRILEESAETAAAFARQKAKAEAEAEEEKLADIAAEKAIEVNRTADKKHRKSIEDDIYTVLLHFVDVGPCASAIVAHMKAGEIPHVTILY